MAGTAHVEEGFSTGYQFVLELVDTTRGPHAAVQAEGSSDVQCPAAFRYSSSA
jgi:hypothetical protein